MTNVTGLTCVICDKTYPADFAGYVCTEHGNEGILDVRYNYERIAGSWTKADLDANRNRTMWRYRPLLPVRPDAPVPPLTVGGTPMYDAKPLAADLGIARVWVKDEGRQPTASLKDRASAMAVVKAQERGTGIPPGSFSRTSQRRVHRFVKPATFVFYGIHYSPRAPD